MLNIKTFYCRVPIFIDQAEETLKLINQKWESIPSDDEKEELFKSLIPEVYICRINFT